MLANIMKNTQLKNFACFKQCLLLLMTISVGASYVLPELQKCPSGFKPYSQHSLKTSEIKLIVTGLNSVEERQDCKWNVLNVNGDIVEGVKAIYRNAELKAEIIGDIAFENLYILEGENETKRWVYLSARANNSDDGNWEIVQDIKMNSKEEKTVLIDIGNADFFNFFLSEGKSHLYCDGKRCGCDNTICDEQRKKLKIIDFGFNAKNKTFSLHLDKDFDYQRVYKFQMDFDTFFKSQLTLRFNVTK